MGFRTCALVLLLAGGPVSAYQMTIDFEAVPYVPGPLAGQGGWTLLGGTGTAEVITGDNGPAVGGQQCVELKNVNGEIRLRLNLPGDLVALGGPLVTLQYDIKNVTNKDSVEPGWGQISTFRTRLYDAQEGYAPIGNMHYDGGGGPAHQAWVGLEADGDPAGWDPDGSPAWTDTNWHTVAWTLDYANRRFVKVTFDGTDYLHPTWFADWNGQGTPGGVADSADWVELRLMADSNPPGNDIWRIDNYVLTAVPEPASLSLLGLGVLAALRRRR